MMQSDLHCDDQKFYSLEKHFKKACSRHPQLKFLKAQWRFDQELIGKALQNVGTIFPHYSRHDASHSRQIIVNIERILGDKIKFLSATDTWLILEAAYNHDIGMVITEKQIKELDTKGFKDFLDSIGENDDNPLQKFAQDWRNDNGILPQKTKSYTFFHQYIQLLSEWYRPRHPEQSAATVRNPVEEIGLNSPRNELLPKRLFNIIAMICKAHGDSFQEVLKLPKAEAGMANEDCHPLYVACLLRMGDLLDVDDNRFCPVMLAMCGKNLPAISKAHNEKHHSIKHLRLDSERIEIKCVCPTPEAYETAYDWFSWLQKEYHEQTQHWDKIVPCKELGRLPTLMTPDVNIADPFLILENGKRPDFKVNKETVLNLVRGTGLYDDEYDAIREILQNAVDSTIHRIWIEKGKEIIDKNLDPSMQALYDIYDQYKIDYSFKEKEGSPGIYILTVTDKGTGISRNDLEYMTEIGSSFKNKAKKDREKEMPMWFRPSGAFGIGLQSAYLLADKFTILTHSMIDGKKLEIQFNKTKNNNIIIKEITSDIPIGTQFTIEISKEISLKEHSYVNQYPDYIRNRINNQNPRPKLQVEKFDCVAETILDTYPVDFSSIIQKINNFFTYSPIQSEESLKDKSRSEQSHSYFDKKTSILLHNIQFGDFKASFSENRFYFRGQEFHGLRPFECLSFKIDFYHTTSSSFLAYNRNRILSDKECETYQKLIQTFKNYIEANLDNIPDQEKPYAAAYYIYNSKDKTNINDKIVKALDSLPIKLYNHNDQILEKTLHKIIDEIKNNTLKIITFLRDANITTYRKRHSFINLIYNKTCETVFHNIKWLLTKENFFYQENINNIRTIVFHKNDIQPVNDDLFKSILKRYEYTWFTNRERGCRGFFPAWSEYRKLSIQTDVIHSYSCLVNIYEYTSYQSDYLLLPINHNYNIDDEHFFDNSDQFIQWVYDNRKNKNVPIEEIKTLNKQLIKHIKKILQIPPDKEDESDDE